MSTPKHHVETLDSRRLLSAVTANVVDGTLFVTGTESGDVIDISRRWDGSTRVAAYTVGGGFTYKVFKQHGFSSIAIDAKGGSDVVNVDGVVAPTGGSVLTGDGNDYLRIDDANINGDLFVDSGEHADTVVVEDSQIEGLSLRGGNGNDRVSFDNNVILDYATLDLGNGHDVLVARGNVAYGFTTFYDGNGCDVVYSRGNRWAGGADDGDFEWSF